jgi:hypothetical protein
VGRLLKHTLLNPLVTLPLILFARYTQKGHFLAEEHATLFSRIKILLYIGLAQRISEWLDRGVANNWCTDQYHWNKEIVVVTGGSDGIGGIIVRLLAERGIKVAVLDIRPLQYTGSSFLHLVSMYHSQTNKLFFLRRTSPS